MYATAKYVRSSARKARLVCDHIRGKSVPEARAILAFAPRGVAKDWSKLLESAVANAEHNHELIGEELRIKEIYRRRRADAEALPPACAGPRDADPQAHQPPLDRAHAEGVTVGQKVHPESMRVGYIHDWQSNWFNERHFAEYLAEDIRIREHIIKRLAHAGLSDITIKKNANEVEVNIRTARPGIVIGKSGSEVDALRKDLHRITRKQIKVNILEIKRPELDAKLVAQSIAEQLQNRVAFRRAMKRALTSAMRSGRQGRQGAGLRAPRRRRDGAHRGLLGRPRAAAHDARRHRLRLLRGAHDLRAHRREVLDQQGRDHARGLRRLRPHRHERSRAAERQRAPGAPRARRPQRPWPWRRWSGRRSRRRTWTRRRPGRSSGRRSRAVAAGRAVGGRGGSGGGGGAPGGGR